MDKRMLKKHLLFHCLSQYHGIFYSQDIDAQMSSAELVMDIDYDKNITKAQFRRFNKMMSQLVDEAESKL